jgi:putative addiction module killer protein
MYTIKIYAAENGESPFVDWLNAIKDEKVQANIYARLNRAKFGNFGDAKPLVNAGGLWEMRIHYGGGYRIYYRVEGKKLILILAGSGKKEQKKVIKKAEKYYNDYIQWRKS